MANYTIYHNPKCSKSRQTLELLEKNNIKPKIVEYLTTTPTVGELTALIAMLGITAENLIRKKEDLYKDLSPVLNTDSDAVNLMCAHPKLIERPIVVCGDRAVIGRPPENILELL